MSDRGAPRLLERTWRRTARGGLQRLCLWLVALVGIGAPVGSTADVVAARYAEPTTRYAHGVLGDSVEWGALRIKRSNGPPLIVRLPEDRVFEDLKPRLEDLDGDGDLEVIVVESHARTGASLAVYDETGKVASTPHIGTAFRWLAPIGAGDLDGDGYIEIAYVDRPHLAKTIRVWRYRRGALSAVASLSGFSNHRIGEDFISGGLRTCDGRPELITADAGWRRVMATRLVGGKLVAKDVGPFIGRASFKAALACR